MKATKIILIVVLALVLLVAAALGLGLWAVNRYVQTPGFKHQVLAAASKATGTAVQINVMKVSIFSGLELRGVTIANPSGFSGNILSAQAFTLRYRLWPLLRKRIEIESLRLETPVINLVRNAKGDWNYDKFSARTAAVETKTQPSTAKPATEIDGMEVSLARVEMQNASVIMAKDGGKELLRLQGANFSTTVNLTSGKFSGSGNTRIDLVNVANSLTVRGISTPVMITAAAVSLAPLAGKVAGGDLTGEASFSVTGDSRYTVRLQLKNVEIVKLLQEAGVAKQVFSAGKLQSTTTLTGAGGLETIVGSGQAEITGGQLVDIPALNLVATLLQVPFLQNLKFDECRIEYSISNNVMATPVISIRSPQAQITGAGHVSLADYSLNHSLRLALAKGTLDHAPKEIREQFTLRDDGTYVLDFKVWGPYDAPKTDLQKRLLKAVGDQLLQKFLK